MIYAPTSPAEFAFAGNGAGYVPVLPAEFSLVATPNAILYAPVPALLSSTGGRWSIGRGRHGKASGNWGRAAVHGQQAGVRWGLACHLSQGTAARWSPTLVRDAQHSGQWISAQALATADRVGWSILLPRDLTSAGRWDRSIAPRDLRLQLLYRSRLPARDFACRGRHQRSDEYGQRPARQPLEYAPVQPVAFDFGGTRYRPDSSPVVWFDFRQPAQARRIAPVDAATDPGWQPARWLGLNACMPWGAGRPSDPPPITSTYPDYPGPIYQIDVAGNPDILDTYMIANSVSLVVLPDRTPVDTTGLRVSRDIDEFAWKITADMKGRTSQALVRPTAAGPKTVELTINGWVWQFILDRIAGRGQHGSEEFTVSGESRTKLLAAPYAPQRSAVNVEDINAMQVCSDQLENTGFTLSWDYEGIGPQDWTISAGAFSYQQQTPMQIIARVATATGAVIRPARDSDALAVVPRYRAAPWAWDTEIMERIIPAEMIIGWDSDWVPNPEYNSCYVSGTSHGVAVDVRRTGTAGDQPAPDVLDDLITDTAPARWRGIAEISKGGNQEVATRVIPLMPYGSAPGLVEPAMLCEIRDPDDTWRGLCLSTEIACSGTGASRVQQTIKLERHHGNG